MLIKLITFKTMNLLPDDLKSKIFQELDAVNLCRLARVSKSTRILADAPESWKIVYGELKHEAKKSHLKNAEGVFVASVNFERFKAERDLASSRAMDATSRMNEVEKRTRGRYKEDLDSITWNTYNTAVSDLLFAEEYLEDSEKNFEEAELEHWEANNKAKVGCYNLRVPLRLRRVAEDALEVWKAESAKCSFNMACLRISAENDTLNERRAWWTARYAFRAINHWEGKATASDLLVDVISK